MVKPMIKTAREASISRMPACEPGVPGRMAWGGYRVHPAPVEPPPTKKLAASSKTAVKYTQKLIMFSQGKTMSRAPTMSGIR